MSNKKNNTAELNDDEYNCLVAVEQVYPADIIDSTEIVNNLSSSVDDIVEVFFDPQLAAANDAFAYGDIYSLNSARRAKHNQSLERRSSKSRLTDRRSAARLCANGGLQQDRRAENRAANIASIKKAGAGTADES